MAPAKDLKELHEEYKQYRLLKKKDDMNSNEEAGTAAYVVSLKWVQRYLKFLLYEQFNRGVGEHQLKYKEDHFSKMLPGPITNHADVIEKDEQRYNLFGTDTIAENDTIARNSSISRNGSTAGAKSFDFVFRNLAVLYA